MIKSVTALELSGDRTGHDKWTKPWNVLITLRRKICKV